MVRVSFLPFRVRISSRSNSQQPEEDRKDSDDASIPHSPEISLQRYTLLFNIANHKLVIRPSLVRNAPVIATQFRLVSTENISPAEAGSIVAAQRKHRPVSPHLSIYQPQITWYLSITHRFTGALLSGGLFLLNSRCLMVGVYVFGAAYLVSPLFGWHMDVASLVAAFGALPVAAKVGIKSIVAFPFAFHSINGLRHLVWDTGASIYAILIDC